MKKRLASEKRPRASGLVVYCVLDVPKLVVYVFEKEADAGYKINMRGNNLTKSGSRYYDETGALRYILSSRTMGSLVSVTHNN
jgi:hypothetical protein